MRATANGLQIEYESLGSRSKPTVLLVMGLGQQLVAWPDDFCQLLVGAGLRVVRFDNRDVGLSSKIEGAPDIGLAQAYLRFQAGLPVPAPYGLEDMADDALGLLDALEIARAHVVGASMGGMIAQILAARRPDRVRTLTSFMSTTSERHLPPGKPEALAILSTRPSDGREALIEYGVRARTILAGPGYPTPLDEMRAASARAVDRMTYGPGFARQTLAVLAAGDRAERLARLGVPTLVLHGGDDPLVPVAHGRRTAELIPGARLEVIEGLGHDIPPGARRQLARLIAEHVHAHEESSTP